MSKIGKKNIMVPSDVKVEINNNKINLEGPKGPVWSSALARNKSPKESFLCANPAVSKGFVI